MTNLLKDSLIDKLKEGMIIRVAVASTKEFGFYRGFLETDYKIERFSKKGIICYRIDDPRTMLRVEQRDLELGRMKIVELIYEESKRENNRGTV